MIIIRFHYHCASVHTTTLERTRSATLGWGKRPAMDASSHSLTPAQVDERTEDIFIYHNRTHPKATKSK